MLLVTASSRFGRPISGGLTKGDPRKYETRAWNYVPKINESNDGSYLLVPIEVVSVQEQVATGATFYFEIVFGESTCEKKVQLSDVSSANCPLKPDGKHSFWKITDYERVWMKNNERNIITVSKIRDLEAGEEITTTGEPTTEGIRFIPINSDQLRDLEMIFNRNQIVY